MDKKLKEPNQTTKKAIEDARKKKGTKSLYNDDFFMKLNS
jgi:hypothetical protein